MRRMIVAALLLCSAVVSAGFWHGLVQTNPPPITNNFYWSAAGSDSNNCQTPASSCQTIAHFNAFSFPANSQANFNGGDTFTGGLAITSSVTTGGLVVTSYGTGQPIISSGNSATCVTITNVAAITINNLSCVGGGNTTNTTAGIDVINSNSSASSITGPTLSNNTITGYGGSGILVRGTDLNAITGFNGTTITGNTIHDVTGNVNNFTPDRVSLPSCINQYDVAAFGLTPNAKAHTNTEISNNTLFNCKGSNPGGGVGGQGNGIQIMTTSTMTIEHNVVHDIGTNGFGAPCGIWMNDVTNVTIQFNEVYNAFPGVGGTIDGCALDFDNNANNSVMQYNWLHDIPAGNGHVIMFCGCPFLGTATSGNDSNTARFNIIYNTAATNGIDMNVAGVNITNFAIYNNTIYAGGKTCLNASTGSTGRFANNICYNTSGKSLNAGSPEHFTGNNYFSTGTLSLFYAGTNYTTLAAFQAATGEEKVGGNPVGSTVDPQFFNAGADVTVNGNLDLVSAYQVQIGSPMLPNAGLNLTTNFSINPGIQDFYGNNISASTLPIGAAAVAAPLTGLGDAAGGANIFAYWGLRGMTKLIDQAGTQKLINARNSSTAETCDIIVSSTNGGLGNTANCSGSSSGQAAFTFCGANCTVAKGYDQSGNGNDFSQATVANQPVLTFNCLASRPCMTGTATTQRLTGSITGSSAANPQTVSVVSVYTGSLSGAENDLFFNGSGNSLGYQGSGLTNIFIYGGGTPMELTAPSQVFHALQFVYNGASSQINIDGTDNGNGTNVGNAIANGGGQGIDALIGSLGEIALFNMEGSLSDRKGFCRNQFVYWATPNVC